MSAQAAAAAGCIVPMLIGIWMTRGSVRGVRGRPHGRSVQTSGETAVRRVALEADAKVEGLRRYRRRVVRVAPVRRMRMT